MWAVPELLAAMRMYAFIRILCDVACAAGGRRQVYVHAEVRARPGDRLVRNVARDPRAGLRAHRVRLVIHTRNRDIRSSVRVPRLVYCTRCSNCTSQWRHYSKV